ncbi:hypothetical protein TRFO_05923 [Tritrichomonas foetus]|uniref:DnaK protein n=1 Tax=Tritrichomonas foetus TaxID=1144522 RepID=A0A1J4K303_9EUKA|nr:hypothetical protein TRFO_05923 [Tritrichomonas foetus]|eukprot:OHT05346.1 hypothetical protein TRFO_05923 [Tritrichomonas foetus]
MFFFLIHFSTESALVIDLGGQYVKACIVSEQGSISFINNENLAPFIPFAYAKTTSSSLIGDEAIRQLKNNRTIGGQFIGAIFGKNRKYLSQNQELYKLSDSSFFDQIHPASLLLYFLTEFSKYATPNRTAKTILIVPGYTTPFIRTQIDIIAKVSFFNDINIVTDVECLSALLIEKYSDHVLDSFKTIMFIDFGSFSTKITFITIGPGTDNKPQAYLIRYAFNEKCGLEETALRIMNNGKGEFKNGYQASKQSLNREKARKKLRKIENIDDYDDVFATEFTKLYHETKNSIRVDEIQLIGGGARLPFVTNLISKIVISDKTNSSKENTIISKNYNNFEAITEGGALIYHMYAKSLTSSHNTLHPIYFKYLSTKYKIVKPKGIIYKSFSVPFEKNNATICLKTHKKFVPKGISTKLFEMSIVNTTQLDKNSKWIFSFVTQYEEHYIRSVNACSKEKCVELELQNNFISEIDLMLQFLQGTKDMSEIMKYMSNDKKTFDNDFYDFLKKNLTKMPDWEL